MIPQTTPLLCRDNKKHRPQATQTHASTAVLSVTPQGHGVIANERELRVQHRHMTVVAANEDGGSVQPLKDTVRHHRAFGAQQRQCALRLQRPITYILAGITIARY